MTQKLNQLAEALGEIKRQNARNRLSLYEPSPKQARFHKLGARVSERALIAGNQLGKTYSAAMEVAMHATGHYPSWWRGKRFDKPLRICVAGETSAAIRDTSQKNLLGADRDGTGSIPADCIDRVTMTRGVADTVDTARVKHVSGGLSRIVFKAYEIGRSRWQGDSFDLIWFDEEPPTDIYMEGLARTVATNGVVMCTFTPLRGRTDVVIRYMSVPSEDRDYVQMTIDDAPHIAPEERERKIAAFAPHERDARARGIPMMGSGLVYPIAESAVVFDLAGGSPHEFELMRPGVRKIIGIDLGVRFFAATLCAHDPETDQFWVLDELLIEDQSAPVHAAAITTRWGPGIPVAFPHDALAREKGSGAPLAALYKQHGLAMLSAHAQFSAADGGGYAVEPGISAILTSMVVGSFKVANICEKTREQLRQYHRDEKTGKIAKTRDHLLDAFRYAWMMRRDAKSTAELQTRRSNRRKRPQYAIGADPFAWGEN